MMSVTIEIDSQLKQCRICLDDEHPDGIISPCLCSGNSAYVHRECLNNWRAINKNRKGFKACDICHFEYVIETVNNNSQDEIKRLRKYYFFVTRDLSLIMLFIQLIILSFAYLLKEIDANDHKIRDLFPDSFHQFLIYYLSAIISLLVIIGLITLCFTCDRRSFPGGNNCGNNGGKADAIACIIYLLIIGVFIVVHSSVMITKEIIQHHTNKLWLRQEAEKYIVKDFQKCREELEKYKIRN